MLPLPLLAAGRIGVCHKPDPYGVQYIHTANYPPTWPMSTPDAPVRKCKYSESFLWWVSRHSSGLLMLSLLGANSPQDCWRLFLQGRLPEHRTDLLKRSLECEKVCIYFRQMLSIDIPTPRKQVISHGSGCAFGRVFDSLNPRYQRANGSLLFAGLRLKGFRKVRSPS